MNKGFLRTSAVTLVVCLCLAFGLAAAGRAYRGTRITVFSDYRSAVELKDGVLKLFDIELEIPFLKNGA